MGIEQRRPKTNDWEVIQLNKRLEGRDWQPQHSETGGAVRLESKSVGQLLPRKNCDAS